MQKFIWLFLAALLAAFIFANSWQDASVSHGVSGTVAAMLAGVGERLGVDGAFSEHEVRKLAHFLEFMLLGAVLCRLPGALRLNRFSAGGYVLFAGLLAAVIDEYIQLYSPGRSSSVQDVLLDFSGVLTAYLADWVWRWSHRK